MMDAEDAQELSAAQCLIRLRAATWGRVAVSIRTIAMVVPLPVRVLDDRLLFVTVRGSTLDRAVQEQAISVQVEGHERAVGVDDVVWSVVVSGICASAGAAADWVGGADLPAGAQVNALPFVLVQGWRAPVPCVPALSTGVARGWRGVAPE